MIEDKEDIKKMVKMMDVNKLIDVLFEEEVIHTISTPTLINHLLTSMKPNKLFMDAMECMCNKDENIKTKTIDEIVEVMATYEISTIEM